MNIKRFLVGSMVLLLVAAICTPLALEARRKSKKDKVKIKIIDVSEKDSEESREEGKKVKLSPDKEVIIVIIKDRKINLAAFLDGLGVDSEDFTGGTPGFTGGSGTVAFEGYGDPPKNPPPTVNPCEFSVVKPHDGSEGNDVIDLSALGDAYVVHGLGGDDTITGPHKPSTLYGDSGNDTITGGNCPDKLYGGEGNDTLNGGPGDDELRGGEGNDVLNGGPGDDVIYKGEDDTVIPSEGDDVIHHL